MTSCVSSAGTDQVQDPAEDNKAFEMIPLMDQQPAWSDWALIMDLTGLWVRGKTPVMGWRGWRGDDAEFLHVLWGGFLFTQLNPAVAVARRTHAAAAVWFVTTLAQTTLIFYLHIYILLTHNALLFRSQLWPGCCLVDVWTSCLHGLRAPTCVRL